MRYHSLLNLFVCDCDHVLCQSSGLLYAIFGNENEAIDDFFSLDWDVEQYDQDLPLNTR